MNTKHTSQPWRKLHHMFQDGSGGDKFYEIRSGAGKLIAKMPGWTKEHEANANLVQAAPKLLAACQELITWFKAGGPMTDGDYVQFPDTPGFGMAATATKEAQP